MTIIAGMASAAAHARQLLISCVSAEFGSYRKPLSGELKRPNVNIHVQEEFIPGTQTLLDKLDTYIIHSDAVIHLVGEMSGALASAADLELITRRYPNLGDKVSSLRPFLVPGAPALSYTQWEAYLAIYHGRHLLIARPAEGTARDGTFVNDPAQQASQAAHLQRLKVDGRYSEINFANADKLLNAVWRALLDLFTELGSDRPKPIWLPFKSLGSLFMGREDALTELRTSLLQASVGRTAIVGKAVHGLGGVGKTRLAVEYALRQEKDYSALLFVVAESPADLARNFAALANVEVLDLPEQSAPQENVRVASVVRWLRENPGWLLIIDNVDTDDAADAVEDLLARLVGGGHVIITSRRLHWSAAVSTHELNELDADATMAFLLARTERYRRKASDDREQALSLGRELGNLALALAQAGAYIAKNASSFAQYRKELETSRQKLMRSSEARMMEGYKKNVASTWLTSFEQLDDAAQHLLHRLAWLSAEPIPEALLDIPAAGADGAEQRSSLAQLAEYSLVTRAQEAPSFMLHRLVQDVIRGLLGKEVAETELGEAVKWVAAGFEHPDCRDVRAELVPHAVSALHFLRNDDYRDMAAGELFDPLAQRVIYMLLTAGSKSISAQYLASLLGDYYEVEPLEGALSKFYEQHPEQWLEIEKSLLKENNYVLRYAMGRTLAEAHKTAPALMVKIVSALDSADMNEFEYAAYALTGIYEDHPELLLKPHHLDRLAEYGAYPGAFAVSNMLIGLVADPRDEAPPIPAPRDLVSSPKLWDSHWEFIKLDVWELEAAADYLAGRPLSAVAGPEVTECYANLSTIKDRIDDLLKSSQVGERTRDLLDPSRYRALAHDSSKIRDAQNELANSDQLRELMWLLFAHPCWSVGEAAAAVAVSLVGSDQRRLALIDELLEDKNWRVQLAANEAAFQLRNIKPGLFKNAVHRFYGDHSEAGWFNCKIRGLCAENLISVILSPGRGRRDLLLEFEKEIRFWLRDEDCWVLEHVYRLFDVLHKRRIDFSSLLSDGVSRLFKDSPTWYQLGRAEFLCHIERNKVALRDRSRAAPQPT
jgi:hypothetical protein